MMRIIHKWTAYRGEYQIPEWTIELNTDEVTLGMLMISAAQLASLGDREWIQSSPGTSGIVPMSFASAAEARDYLVACGVLEPHLLNHFLDLDNIVTVGQIMSILGSLFTHLMGH